jgi:hypothetical protein
VAVLAFGIIVPVHANTIDIKTFGARCNGSDDAAAVQNAIHVLANGDTLLVSCQASIGSAGIVLQGKSNVTILGTGSPAGFRALSATNQAIVGVSTSGVLKVASCTNCTVKNVLFEGNSKPAAGIVMQYNTGTVVTGNIIQNVGDGSGQPSAALEASDNTDCRYTNNTIIHTVGIYKGNGPRGMWIGNVGHTDTRPIITGNNITNIHHTGIAGNRNNATISYNTIYNAGTGANYGKAGGACIKETGKSSVQEYIQNNDLRFCGQGLQLEGTANVAVSNNLFRDMVDSGVYMSGGQGSGSTVDTGDTITSNTFKNCANAGITFIAGNNFTITNNLFTDDSAGMFRMGSDIKLSSDWTSPGGINNITIYNNEIGTNLHAGIALFDAGGHIGNTGPITIKHNSLTESAAHGLLIQEQESGYINNVVLTSDNCFSANRYGAVSDNRGSRSIASPGQYSSCP